MTRRVCERSAWIVERAVVLQVLREDHGERWCRAELRSEISDFDAAALDGALTRLEQAGVLRRAGESVWASRATRMLDELEMIGI
jgi:hypothetical protein